MGTLHRPISDPKVKWFPRIQKPVEGNARLLDGASALPHVLRN
jgi:hypothetical protein